jgi:hypothetical protein
LCFIIFIILKANKNVIIGIMMDLGGFMLVKIKNQEKIWLMRPVRGFDILLFSLGFSLSQGIFFDSNAARPVFSGFGAALAAFSRSPYLMPAVD